MSRNCRNGAIIPMTLLLLIGSLIMVQGPADFRWGYVSYEQPIVENHIIFLTEDSPTFGIEVARYASRAVITNLNAIGGSIRINAYNDENETIMSLHGISRIVEDGIAIEAFDRATTLNFTREDSDVEVSFTLEEWAYPPVATIDAAVAMPVQFFFYGAALFIIGLVLILKIESECHQFHGQSRWRRREGPLAIIVLVVISASLATPLIYGNAHGDFVDTLHRDTSTLEFSFFLTEAAPEVSIDVIDHLVQEYNSVEIRIDNLVTSESIRVRTFADARLLALLPLVTSFEASWIDITIGDETSHTLEFRRVEADTEVSFNISIIRTYTDHRIDPIGPILLALVAILPASLALYQALDVKRRLDMQEDELYNSYAQQ
ncbi:MAG: hypothetical protein ACW98Y_03240 [Candidatus Thorarchaeota archaeon]